MPASPPPPLPPRSPPPTSPHLPALQAVWVALDTDKGGEIGVTEFGRFMRLGQPSAKEQGSAVMATRKRTSMHKRAEVEAKIADVKQRRTEEMRRERLRFEAEVCLCAVCSPSHASCTSS